MVGLFILRTLVLYLTSTFLVGTCVHFFCWKLCCWRKLISIHPRYKHHHNTFRYFKKAEAMLYSEGSRLLTWKPAYSFIGWLKYSFRIKKINVCHQRPIFNDVRNFSYYHTQTYDLQCINPHFGIIKNGMHMASYCLSP